MQKLKKPVVFDKLYDVVVYARDGERFYVCNTDELEEFDTLADIDIKTLKLKPLLVWALENDYPIKNFIFLQKKLVHDYFDK